MSISVLADQQSFDAPYINQKRDLHKYQDNACGACCLEMAYRYFIGGECTEKETLAFFADIADNYGTDSASTNVKKMFKKANSKELDLKPIGFGKDYEMGPLAWEDVVEFIDHGCLIITSSAFTTHGHYILIVGYTEENGKKFVIVNDPAGNFYPKKTYYNDNGKNARYEFGTYSIGRWGIIVGRGYDESQKTTEPEKPIEQPKAPKKEKPTQTQTHQTPSSDLPEVTHPSQIKEVNNTSPVVSPNGRAIAFVSDRDGNNEIYLMLINGTHQTRVTIESSNEYAPMWTADSNNIIFTSNKGGKRRLWKLNLRTQQIELVIKNSSEECYCSTLLDDGFIQFWLGNQIWKIILIESQIYSLQRGENVLYCDNNYLVTGNYDKSYKRPIIGSSENIVCAYKTPGKVFFTTHRNENYDIMCCNPDGSGLQYIIEQPGDQKNAYVITCNGQTFITFDSNIDPNHPNDPTTGFDIYISKLGHGIIRLTWGSDTSHN